MPTGVFYDHNSGSGGYDDLTAAKPCGDYVYEYPIEDEVSAVVVRQRFSQLRANFSKQAVGTGGPSIAGIGSLYLINEESFADVGGGSMEWDCVWATIPNDYTEYVTVTKNFQGMQYTIAAGSPPSVYDMSINSWSREVKAVKTYHFFRGGAPGLPVVPVLTMYQFYDPAVPQGAKSLTDNGTGFPTGTVGGVPGLYTNNIGACALPGATIEKWKGDIFVMATLFG
jgi:hypothetical protein